MSSGLRKTNDYLSNTYSRRLSDDEKKMQFFDSKIELATLSTDPSASENLWLEITMMVGGGGGKTTPNAETPNVLQMVGGRLTVMPLKEFRDVFEDDECLVDYLEHVDLYAGILESNKDTMTMKMKDLSEQYGVAMTGVIVKDWPHRQQKFNDKGEPVPFTTEEDDKFNRQLSKHYQMQQQLIKDEDKQKMLAAKQKYGSTPSSKHEACETSYVKSANAVIRATSTG